MGNEESVNEDKEIVEDFGNSGSEKFDSKSDSPTKKESNSNCKNSIVTPHMKSLLQWYVHNPLLRE